jgi:hypothetical protein
MQMPAEPPLPENHFQPSYPGQYGSLNPYQQQLQSQNMALANNGLNLQNNLLQTTLQNLWRGGQGQGQDQENDQPQSQSQPSIPAMPQSEQNAMTVNLHVHIDSATASHFSNLRPKSPLQSRGPGLRRTQAREFSREPSEKGSDVIPETAGPQRGCSLEEIREEDKRERWLPGSEFVPESLASEGSLARAGQLHQSNEAGSENGRFDYARARKGIMSMANSPLSSSLLAVLSERGEN